MLVLIMRAFKRTTPEVKCPSDVIIKGACHHHDLPLLRLTLLTWLRGFWLLHLPQSGFTTVMLLAPMLPTFHMVLSLEGSRYVQATCREWELHFTSLRAECLHNLEFLCMGELSLLSIYSFILYLFVSVWPQGSLFCTFSYNAILFYFVAQTVPPFSSRTSCSWLLCPFDIPPSL